MTLLLIAAAWILILSLVTGLCVAARLGDVERPERAAVPAAWDETEQVAIPEHGGSRFASAESGTRIAA